jgi:hypothetical protein
MLFSRVWQGSVGDRRPYANLTGYTEVIWSARKHTRLRPRIMAFSDHPQFNLPFWERKMGHQSPDPDLWRLGREDSVSVRVSVEFAGKGRLASSGVG